MRAARSPDRTQTTAGAISHRRPDRTYSTPSWCEPDRRPSARPIRRCGLPAAERSVATDRPVRVTIVVDRCGVLSWDTALAVLASALCVSRVARPASAGGVAPPLDVDQFGVSLLHSGMDGWCVIVESLVFGVPPKTRAATHNHSHRTCHLSSEQFENRSRCRIPRLGPTSGLTQVNSPRISCGRPQRWRI